MKPTLALIIFCCTSAWAGGEDWQHRPGAFYSVPVAADLARYARFALADFKIRTRSGVTSIEYTLPLELTGRPVRIESEGRTNQELKGPLGRMICEEQMCRATYTFLYPDEREIRAYLEGKGYTGEALESRLRVSASFIGDPEGEIHF